VQATVSALPTTVAAQRFDSGWPPVHPLPGQALSEARAAGGHDLVHTTLRRASRTTSNDGDKATPVSPEEKETGCASPGLPAVSADGCLRSSHKAGVEGDEAEATGLVGPPDGLRRPNACLAEHLVVTTGMRAHAMCKN
jgi:hypothetical protein